MDEVLCAKVGSNANEFDRVSTVWCPATKHFKRSCTVELMDLELRQLVEKAKTQGFLTYADVTTYLPDEDCNSEKLDSLLLMLEQNNIELLDRAPNRPQLIWFRPTPATTACSTMTRRCSCRSDDLLRPN